MIDAVCSIWDDPQWHETALGLKMCKIESIYKSGIEFGLIQKIEEEI